MSREGVRVEKWCEWIRGASGERERVEKECE